jgi:hypothetical protein
MELYLVFESNSKILEIEKCARTKNKGLKWEDLSSQPHMKNLQKNPKFQN